MLHFTGDTHGDIQRLTKSLTRKIKKNDTLIICGDFGFLWDNSKQEKKNLEKISRLPFTVCFVDGTHENFELLRSYPVAQWNGGKVHRIAKNIIHLMRGQIFEIEGKKLFTFGGGESPEIEFKDDEEITERPEVPTKNEMLEGISAMEANAYKVDYIITHEPPSQVRDFLRLSETATSSVTAFGAFLDELSNQAEYKKWFFGSLHLDKNISTSTVSVFTDIHSEQADEEA